MDPSPLHDAHKSLLDGLDLGHLAGHIVSLGAVFGYFIGLLPALAALGAVIWYTIAILETRTVQSYFRRRRFKGKQRRAAVVKRESR